MLFYFYRKLQFIQKHPRQSFLSVFGAIWKFHFLSFFLVYRMLPALESYSTVTVSLTFQPKFFKISIGIIKPTEFPIRITLASNSMLELCCNGLRWLSNTKWFENLTFCEIINILKIWTIQKFTKNIAVNGSP